MKSLQNVLAPAKLNLFLHITGRRTDGYHLLQSVFMLIDWYDTLHFEVRPNGQISREDLSVPLPADDLITRAARLLQQTSGTSMGAHIAIDKSIPAQAGMGGGSSDAATCLLALNKLWNLNYSVNQLAQLGLQLGADVPFFIRGHNAWVEGIGEIMTPVTLSPAQFAVVKPPEGLETSKIFGDQALKRDTKPATISVFAADPYGFGHNDLQPVAQRLCPQISESIAWLETARLASAVVKGRMTGSGSAVFAQVPRGTDLSQMPQVPATWQNWKIRMCGNLEVHPQKGWASSDD
ncbi:MULTISPECIES: 4-(cytidine 5'-diphospho)-2-C-methyl-D-erythritol kinase [unclassified Limnohabitans]|uniref:4-(cytidine 5'-diphospho)-2-C-methyl-D-erythritol kinase n=1 Tax=unclassified Limnohabitans TaxID=2626134 RepID=UPI0006DC73E6|nr:MULTISPECIES: 4-(cytidine 5'-diphospho)-2-C-methyl-D-erythritol kinase [unclassified Limnohabitans]ALK91295.1 4-diphosphocytidyl-2-C-methyl-D-erythritol kinase [Limnohabitans sp. 103DPR2]MBU3722082.1 4-(cytidine 5'-diphospho)-2-C-methyl-D-erythritol kinase [Limnohabitans sp.]PUE38042.1 4-(cytidine 5'-diphospho)-2-C-methyl-D-erythritol kinase [Limnohabitans sp. Hippo4]